MSDAQKERLSRAEKLKKKMTELEAQLEAEVAKERNKNKDDNRAKNHAVGEAVRAEMERDAGFRRDIMALLDRSLKTKHHRGLFGLKLLAEDNAGKPMLHLAKGEEEQAA